MNTSELQEQYVRLRVTGMTPRWLMAEFRQAYPELARANRANGHQYGNSAPDGWRFLRNEPVVTKKYGRLFDHFGSDIEGRLVTEPYMGRDGLAKEAREFARAHGLAFSVEPRAYHNHPNCIRAVFWIPKNAAIRKRYKIDLGPTQGPNGEFIHDTQLSNPRSETPGPIISQ
jgi:hypothetical protein